MNIDKIVRKALAQDDPSDWFDQLYAAAGNDPSQIPWGGLEANPRLVEWFETHSVAGNGRSACIIGCGLGGDAEAFAQRGFAVTAFDISETAVAWCKRRFPDSPVNYVAADLFNPPADWLDRFDFVLDVRIVQSLPLKMREDAISAETNLVAPNGDLLIITARRPDSDTNPSGPPWALSHNELMHFTRSGLTALNIEALTDYSERWRAHFRKPAKADA